MTSHPCPLCALIFAHFHQLYAHQHTAMGKAECALEQVRKMRERLEAHERD